MLTQSSVFWVIKLHGCTCLHHILECAHLLHVGAAWCPKVAGLGWLLAWGCLLSNRRCNIIGLVLIDLTTLLIGSASFGKGPSWEILLCGGVWSSLWYISAWAYWSRCWGVILKSTSPSESEGILRLFLVLWSLTWKVLRAWGLLEGIKLHLLK